MVTREGVKRKVSKNRDCSALEFSLSLFNFCKNSFVILCKKKKEGVRLGPSDPTRGLKFGHEVPQMASLISKLISKYAQCRQEESVAFCIVTPNTDT